ncbi:MAG TPA: hypothetical protein VKU41_22705 [Polyangiaceae bacterium]|nr:hypothetical protein [Polyangiaceae bacterium]
MKLTRFETRWAEAALTAIFPGAEDAGLRGIRSMDVAGFLAELLRRVPLAAAAGFRAAVWIVALAPVLLVGRAVTLAGLGQEDREAVVERLASSRWYALRSLVLVLKTFGALLYASDDGVRARMLATSRTRRLVSLRVKGAPT